MIKAFKTFIASMPLGARCLVLMFALSFPLALALNSLRWFDAYGWLALAPGLVWKGQVWRVLSYAVLPGGLLDWLFGLFWLVTLVMVAGRVWSGRGLWGYCLLAAVAGALPLVLLTPASQSAWTGNTAIIFALLVAWEHLYRRERLILLGIGEISVRQAAMLIALLNASVIFFCAGWLLTLSMLCGGAAGWICLTARHKWIMTRRSQPVESERIARLEL
jgi:membrane associated rhomboid family serine protease